MDLLKMQIAFGQTVQDITASRRRFEFSPQDSNSEGRPGDLVEHLLTGELVSLDVLTGQRKHMVRAQRQMYSSLLTQGLISRSAWMLLDRAADTQLEFNYFHLDQFRFLLTNAFQAKRFQIAAALQRGFWTSVPGVLLLFLKQFGKVPIDEMMKKLKQSRSCGFRCQNDMNNHNNSDRGKKGSGSAAAKVTSSRSTSGNIVLGNDVSRKKSIQDDALLGDDRVDLEAANNPPEAQNDMEIQQPFGISVKTNEEAESIDNDESEGLLPGFADVSKSVGIPLSAEEWLYTFTLACWGFILAQQDSAPLVDEMFTVTPGLVAFSEERKALKVEIQEGCTLPALFLDAVARHAPKVIARIKRSHALSEANNLLFGAVSTLNSRGLLERMELKRLLRFAEKSLRRIRNCEIELQHPITVGHQARLLRENPNYFPFSSRFSTMGSTVPTAPHEVERKAAKITTATTGTQLEKQKSSTISGPPSLPQRQTSILLHSTAAGTKPSLYAPVQVVRKSRQHFGVIQRTRSFSDFNPLRHELEDGTTDAAFINLFSRAEHEEASVDELFAPSTELVIDRMKPMDLTKLREALKLDDSELKKY
jgi:hypothetical protein